MRSHRRRGRHWRARWPPMPQRGFPAVRRLPRPSAARTARLKVGYASCSGAGEPPTLPDWLLCEPGCRRPGTLLDDPQMLTGGDVRAHRDGAIRPPHGHRARGRVRAQPEVDDVVLRVSVHAAVVFGCLANATGHDLDARTDAVYTSGGAGHGAVSGTEQLPIVHQTLPLLACGAIACSIRTSLLHSQRTRGRFRVWTVLMPCPRCEEVSPAVIRARLPTSPRHSGG
jgi:hypothetical protein